MQIDKNVTYIHTHIYIHLHTSFTSHSYFVLTINSYQTKKLEKSGKIIQSFIPFITPFVCIWQQQTNKNRDVIFNLQ